jgi:hypothetical protein
MEEQLLTLATEQGIWAFLCMALLIYILKKQEERDDAQEERERKYQDLLTQLSQKFNIVTSIQEDVSSIKKQLEK